MGHPNAPTKTVRSIWTGTHVYVSTKLLAFRSSWIFNLEGGCTLFVKTHVLSTPIGNPTRRTDNDQCASARIRQMIQCHRQDKNLESDLRRRDNLGLVTSNPATPTATLHSIAWSWFVGFFNFMTLDLGSLPWAWVLRMCSQFSTCTKAHRGPKRASFGHASLTWLDSKPPKRRCHVDTKSKFPRIWKRG